MTFHSGYSVIENRLFALVKRMQAEIARLEAALAAKR